MRQDFSSPSSGQPAAPGVEKWVWKLFTGEAYPYIRRTLQQQKGGPPTPDDIERKFFEIYTQSLVKIMVMELVGIGLEFQDLAEHRHGSDDFIGLMADPIGYLGRSHGGGKFKLSFYYGEQFVATQNFKVAGRPQWNMRKCLTSLLDAMKHKDQDAPAPATSFDQLLDRLCARYAIPADAARTDKTSLLNWIRLTAGNQYEDYFALLLNLADYRPVSDWLLLELASLHRAAQPAG
ncbi:MAG: hypothetical protein AB1515_02210 [Nitrospirota bacterium]